MQVVTACKCHPAGFLAGWFCVSRQRHVPICQRAVSACHGTGNRTAAKSPGAHLVAKAECPLCALPPSSGGVSERRAVAHRASPAPGAAALSFLSGSFCPCTGMKRPLSPGPPGEREPPASGAAECAPRPPETPKAKRERKRPSYTLCAVCNIQLNSAAQAQVHCGGRAHQRRLRQLRLGPGPSEPGQCAALGHRVLRHWR